MRGMSYRFTHVVLFFFHILMNFSKPFPAKDILLFLRSWHYSLIIIPKVVTATLVLTRKYEFWYLHLSKHVLNWLVDICICEPNPSSLAIALVQSICRQVEVCILFQQIQLLNTQDRMGKRELPKERKHKQCNLNNVSFNSKIRNFHHLSIYIPEP